SILCADQESSRRRHRTATIRGGVPRRRRATTWRRRRTAPKTSAPSPRTVCARSGSRLPVSARCLHVSRGVYTPRGVVCTPSRRRLHPLGAPSTPLGAPARAFRAPARPPGCGRSGARALAERRGARLLLELVREPDVAEADVLQGPD